MAEDESDGQFACVAVFEFDANLEADRIERVELHRGTESSCNALARKIERAGQRGRGIRYHGDRKKPPLYAVVAVCPVSAVESDR